MNKLQLAICFLIPLISGCHILDDGMAGKGCYVRIVNTGTTPTTGYIIDERVKHKAIQHFFPALNPGDTTKYLRFRTFNEGGKVTVLSDSFAIARRMADCNPCSNTDAIKVTVGVSYLPRTQAGQKQAPVVVSIYYNR